MSSNRDERDKRDKRRRPYNKEERGASSSSRRDLPQERERYVTNHRSSDSRREYTTNGQHGRDREEERYDRDRRKDVNERDREGERRTHRDDHERRHPERERDVRRSASPDHRPGRAHSRSRSEKSGSRSLSPPKGKPNFAPSGLLAAETNTVKASDGTSTVLKYNEPPEARKPPQNWRLYVFKGNDEPDLLHIYRQSAYLIGRDRLVADIPVDHPSCSKQHAVIQYRQVQKKDEFGSSKAVIKPFILDLESTNGTQVNGVAIPAARYYELQAGDVIKVGLSTKEYVFLHDEVA